MHTTSAGTDAAGGAEGGASGSAAASSAAEGGAAAATSSPAKRRPSKKRHKMGYAPAQVSEARRHIVQLFEDVLQSHVDDPQQLSELRELNAARNIEIGIYNACVANAMRRNIERRWTCATFTMLYRNRARGVYANLLPTSYVGNTRLIARLARREFLPHQLAFMSPLELCPERWQDILDEKRLLEERRSEIESQQYSTIFYCRKCHQRKTTYYQLQTRSADEPMTVFITCQVCQNKWRV